MGIHLLSTSHWNISWAPPPMLGVRLDVLGSTEALEKRGVAVAAGHLKDVRDPSRADKTLVGDVPWSAANAEQDHGYPTARHEQKGVSQVGMKPVNMEIHSTAAPLESCCGVYTSRKSDVRKQNRPCMAYFSRNCAMFRANVGESAMEWSLFFITAL